VSNTTSDEPMFASMPHLPPWVGQLAKYLGAAWPNWKPSPTTMVVYYDTLHDLDPRHIAAAAKALVREPGEFAPSAGTIRAEAIKARKAAKAHPPECACSFACVNRLPVADRWGALSPAMRTMLDRDDPTTARSLRDASRALHGDRVDGVRRLLGCVKAVNGTKLMEGS
jgi:hypothetical protein